LSAHTARNKTPSKHDPHEPYTILLPACCFLSASKGEAKDLLFVLVERFKFCVLEYDAASGESCMRVLLHALGCFSHDREHLAACMHAAFLVACAAVPQYNTSPDEHAARPLHGVGIRVAEGQGEFKS
jgi:hypothetical protein